MQASVELASPRKVSDADREIGVLVRQARRRIGLTLDDLAKRLGLSYQQVHKYENGTNRISAGTLASISTILNVPIEQLYPDMFHAHASEDGSEVSRLRSEASRLVQTMDEQHQLEAVVTVLKSIAH